ncbi:hypothetical protein N7501_005386 [Penicillium viridicatum]|nr:hypothetical protein N7501_005386 [Penicillium viridicatum]
MATQPASQALNYNCTLVAALYNVACFLSRGSPHQMMRKYRPERQTRLQSFLTAIIVLTYTIQAILGVTVNDFYRSQSFLVYMTSLAAVWSAVWLRRNHPSKYELVGTSVVTAGFENSLLALLLFLKQKQWEPTTQIAISAIRLLLLVLVVITTLLETRQIEKIASDESRPFLNGNRSAYDAVSSPDLDGSSALSDSDSDSDKNQNTRAAQVKKLCRARLYSLGGWWSYLEEFSIFLPYLVPRNNRKVQLCMENLQAVRIDVIKCAIDGNGDFMIIPWEEQKSLNRNVIEEPDRRPNNTLSEFHSTPICV